MLNLTYKLKACTIMQMQTLQPKSCLPGARARLPSELAFLELWDEMTLNNQIHVPNRNRLRQFFILIRFTDLN